MFGKFLLELSIMCGVANILLGVAIISCGMDGHMFQAFQREKYTHFQKRSKIGLLAKKLFRRWGAVRAKSDNFFSFFLNLPLTIIQKMLTLISKRPPTYTQQFQVSLTPYGGLISKYYFVFSCNQII